MDQALQDLQTLQNDMLGRWGGIPEIGNYILKPDQPTIDKWMGMIENIRQFVLASAPPAKTDAPATDTKKK